MKKAKGATRPPPGVDRIRRLRDRLLRKLPDLEQVLRGSLVSRFRRCGRATCHCARKGDPGHGPAYYLMVTVATGKTLLVYVPAVHKREVAKWIDNFRRSRETVEKISSLNRELLRQGKLFPEG